MAPASLEFLDHDAWWSIRRDLASGQAEGAYWTVRTFGLDGRVTFHLDGDIFVWGGFLLDLGCALATWLGDRPPKFRFLPVEQANPVVIEVTDGQVALHSGYQSVVVPLATATSGFRSFLEQLGDAALREAPGLATITGFEWLARYGPYR